MIVPWCLHLSLENSYLWLFLLLTVSHGSISLFGNFNAWMCTIGVLLAWNGANFLRWHLFLSLSRSNSYFKETIFKSFNMLSLQVHLSSVPVIPRMNSWYSAYSNIAYCCCLLFLGYWVFVHMEIPSFHSDCFFCCNSDLTHIFIEENLGNFFQSPLSYESQNIISSNHIYYHLTCSHYWGKTLRLPISNLLLTILCYMY